MNQPEGPGAGKGIPRVTFPMPGNDVRATPGRGHRRRRPLRAALLPALATDRTALKDLRSHRHRGRS